jgi:hypothetical protein
MLHRRVDTRVRLVSSALVILLAVSSPALAQIVPSSGSQASSGECGDSSTSESAGISEAAARRHDVIETICERLIDGYVDEEQGMLLAERIRSRRDAGCYDGMSSDEDLAGALTRDLQELSHDLHLTVIPPRPVSTGREGAGDEGRSGSPASFFRSVNYGFPRVEVMRDNIGYIELLAFMDAPEAFERARHAMSLLKDVDALIVDLRRNGGGTRAMLQFLASYFFAERTVLMTNQTRGASGPEDVSTLDPPDPRLVQVPLFVLTSRTTCSAAEAFAFGMRINQRAVLVGEATAGGGHYGGTVPVSGGFALWLPHGRTYDKRTGKGFENEGVEPHVALPADQALEGALVEARTAAKQHGAAREAEEARIREELEAAVSAACELAGSGDVTAARAELEAGFRAAACAGLLTEASINRIGYRILRAGLPGLAIVAFRHNVERFPASYNVYDSLGEAYLEAGEDEKALANYRRSLELNPRNENAMMKLEELEH